MRSILILLTLITVSFAADLRRRGGRDECTTKPTTTTTTTTPMGYGYHTSKSTVSKSITSAGTASKSTTSKSTTSKSTTSSSTTIKATTKSTTTTDSNCAYTKCIKPSNVPRQVVPIASAFCEFILHSTPKTSTVLVTQTTSTTITPSPSTTTTTVTISPATTTTITTVTSTETSTTTNTVTSTNPGTVGTAAVDASTFVNYATQAPANKVKARDIDVRGLAIPTDFVRGCSNPIPSLEQLDKLCSCFLTSATLTSTSTTTSTFNAIGTTTTITLTTTLITPTATSTTMTTVTSVVTTSTTTFVDGGRVTTITFPAAFCGVTYTDVPAASTSGSITCSSSVAAPSANALLRIEGDDSEGTIFEDCIATGPGLVSTQSGGTHECDGTNNAVNPNPGTTPTNLLNAASMLNGFGFDGPFIDSADDFDITTIGTTTADGLDGWDFLINGQFTRDGGCQYEVNNNDRTLWAFPAHSVSAFLKVSPDYASAQAGSGTVSVTITDYLSGSPVPGATIAGTTSNNQGIATFAVPSVVGCYQWKATGSGALRSNAFYLNVFKAS